MFATILLAIFGLSQAQTSCPELSCSVDCLIPVKDQWGCPTCECDWCDSVSANYCKLDCSNGYELFELTMNDQQAGVWCPICKCAQSTDSTTNTTAKDNTYTDTDYNYEASYQAYEKQESLDDVSLNLKKALRVQNIVMRQQGPEGNQDNTFEELKRTIMDVLDIDDKAVEEFQETRQETPPVVPIALKRHQTAEAVNKTRQQVAPTRDWNQVNSTMQDTMMKVMKYLSTAEETPRADDIQEWREKNGRDADAPRGGDRDPWEFSRLNELVDDDTAKAAKEARENWSESEKYGLFLYRMFVKAQLEEASADNDVLTDAQRAQAKKMAATLSKMAQENEGEDWDLNKALEERAKTAEERKENFGEGKYEAKADFYDNLKDNLDLDKEVEEALDERVENVNHHPARLAYLKRQNEEANADWSVSKPSKPQWGGSFNFGGN